LVGTPVEEKKVVYIGAALSAATVIRPEASIQFRMIDPVGVFGNKTALVATTPGPFRIRYRGDLRGSTLPKRSVPYLTAF